MPLQRLTSAVVSTFVATVPINGNVDATFFVMMRKNLIFFSI